MLEFKEIDQNMLAVVDHQFIKLPNGIIDNFAGTWFFNSLNSEDLRKIADKLDELNNV